MKKQQTHAKKMVAPIVIAILVVLYYLGFGIACMVMDEFPLAAKLLFGLIPLAFAGVSIFVLVERIKEIRSGEEDDLSQY